MEGSGGPHRVKQRLLADPGEALPSTGERDATPAPAPPTPDPTAIVATPRAGEPSDLELRRRQTAWRRERARFERSKTPNREDRSPPG